jgi:uncharacterized protein
LARQGLFFKEKQPLRGALCASLTRQIAQTSSNKAFGGGRAFTKAVQTKKSFKQILLFKADLTNTKSLLKICDPANIVSESLTEILHLKTIAGARSVSGMGWKMAVAHTLSVKPVTIGLKHAGLSLVTFIGVMALGAGSIQAFGNPDDAGPRASAPIPKVQIERAGAVTPSEPPKDASAMGWLPWRLPDGAMTPWMTGTPPPDTPVEAISPEEAARLAAEASARGEPKATSVLSAAAADAAPATGGQSRILAPQFGAVSNPATTTEAGVRVIRGSTRGAALAQAPVAGVHQQGPAGLLPIIGLGGRTPFDVYKKPFSDTGRPKVAMVIGGLGLNARITQRAIDELPAEITLSFVPYADNLQGWINKARADGHEVLIEIPMEPMDYPDNDPGPHTLLTSANAEENQRRLEYLLSRASGYFGVTNYLGGKYAASGDSASATMRAIKSRGLAFISDGSAAALGSAAANAGMRNAQADRSIDQRPSGDDITAQLGGLEAIATQQGASLGFGVAYSVTIDQVARWAREASRRGVVLAPASAVAS